MVVYYYNQTKNIENTHCYKNEENEIAKMPSNGDAYLKALLKRVCKDNNKNKSKLPTISITVFVKDLIKDHFVNFYLKNSDSQITNFILLNNSQSHPLSLFRPPNTYIS